MLKGIKHMTGIWSSLNQAALNTSVNVSPEHGYDYDFRGNRLRNDNEV